MTQPDATSSPQVLYVWLVPSEDVLEQPGSWRIRKWDTEPFPEGKAFALSEIAPTGLPYFATDDMVEAAIKAGPIQNNEIARITCRRMWKAMVEVAVPSATATTDAEDAARWREHVKVMKASTFPGALLMRFLMHEHGKQWGIEYVLDADRFGRDTYLGIEAVGLAAKHKAKELFEAIAAESK